MEHGHSKSERRNLALHRLAFEKLRADPIGGKEKMARLLEKWLRAPHLRRQARLLEEWRRAIELPLDDLESRILSDAGQSLRQSSPMGVLITPAERFAVFREILEAEHRPA
jgi:hypothetical protein